MTRQDNTPVWQTSGFTTQEGVVGRRVQPIVLVVPTHIWLEENRLAWFYTNHADGEARADKRVITSAGAMDAFLRLSDATPEEILRYAKRWGPIGFCRHGLPATHKSRWGPDRTDSRTCHVSGSRRHSWESLEFWQLTSRRARALLNIGAKLSADQPGAEEDWKILDCAFVNPRNSYEWKIPNQRSTLEWQLTRWMQMGLLVPVVKFRDKRLSFSLDVLTILGLFGFLAYQLALAISSTDGLSVCSACGQAHVPARKPTANHRTYCSDCRKSGRPLRDASRDYRQRKLQSMGKRIPSTITTL
jgi:hypothetical protein